MKCGVFFVMEKNILQGKEKKNRKTESWGQVPAPVCAT